MDIKQPISQPITVSTMPTGQPSSQPRDVKMDIKAAIEFIISIENLRTKQDLDNWCGDMGKKKLFLYVKRLAPEHWESIKTPKNSVGFYYQQMLTGYKIYKK